MPIGPKVRSGSFSDIRTTRSQRPFSGGKPTSHVRCGRALELNPNFGTAYGLLGWALAFDGQSEDAIIRFERAIRMSPHDPLRAYCYSGTGVAHYLAGRYT